MREITRLVYHPPNQNPRVDLDELTVNSSPASVKVAREDMLHLGMSTSSKFLAEALLVKRKNR